MTYSWVLRLRSVRTGAFTVSQPLKSLPVGSAYRLFAAEHTRWAAAFHSVTSVQGSELPNTASAQFETRSIRSGGESMRWSSNVSVVLRRLQHGGCRAGLASSLIAGLQSHKPLPTSPSVVSDHGQYATKAQLSVGSIPFVDLSLVQNACRD